MKGENIVGVSGLRASLKFNGLRIGGNKKTQKNIKYLPPIAQYKLLPVSAYQKSPEYLLIWSQKKVC